MSKTLKEKPLLTSKEAKSILKISDCHLAHLRMEGKLPFVKKGNAFMYDQTGVNELIEKIKSVNGA